MLKGKGPGPSLQHFIVRAEMIQSYRKAVRATRPLPDSKTRRETLDFLRADFERLKDEHDLTKLRSNLSHFNKLLKQMTPSLILTGLTLDNGNGNGDGNGRTGIVGAKLVGQAKKARTSKDIFA